MDRGELGRFPQETWELEKGELIPPLLLDSVQQGPSIQLMDEVPAHRPTHGPSIQLMDWVPFEPK